jgi:hypothetical protein
MDTRAKTKAKNAQKSMDTDVAYSKLHTDLLAVKRDMDKKNWRKAIESLQVANVGFSQLPPNVSRSIMKNQIKDLTVECALQAPTSVLEQPMYEIKTLENGNRVRVEMVPFSVVGSNFDPMCLCSPRAQGHWCTVCAEIDPQKYTRRGLMDHNAIAFE